MELELWLLQYLVNLRLRNVRRKYELTELRAFSLHFAIAQRLFTPLLGGNSVRFLPVNGHCSGGL